MPSFTLLMLYDDAYAALGAVTARRAQDYANRRGYSFQCSTRLFDPSIHPHWNKILMVRQALSLASEWFVWIDADVYVLQPDFDLASLVRPDKDLLLSTDAAGYCCGFFMIRKCAWSMRLLDAMIFLGTVRAATTTRRPLNDQDSLKLLIQSYPVVADRCAGISDAIIQNPNSVKNPDAFAHHFWANGGQIDRILDEISQRSTSSGASPS